jgi:hypothetical protein
MRFSVTWDPSAEDELARIWMAASDRRAVTDASYEIELRLGQQGSAAGTPLGPAWELRLPPLEVVFIASVDGTEIRVIWVGYYP